MINPYKPVKIALENEFIMRLRELTRNWGFLRNMTAIKQFETHTTIKAAQRPARQIEPADYSDIVTDEHFIAMREQSESILKKDEWVLIDGPAW